MPSELDLLKKQLYGDSSVRARNVGVFPGSNPNVTAEDIAREINKSIEEIGNGDFEII